VECSCPFLAPIRNKVICVVFKLLILEASRRRARIMGSETSNGRFMGSRSSEVIEWHFYTIFQWGPSLARRVTRIFIANLKFHASFWIFLPRLLACKRGEAFEIFPELSRTCETMEDVMGFILDWGVCACVRRRNRQKPTHFFLAHFTMTALNGIKVSHTH
jgi:hypothetical protein